MVLFAIFTIFCGIFGPWMLHLPRFHALVLNVHDGDSLLLSIRGEEIRARLIYIDAPELGQGCLNSKFQLGHYSKRQLQSLIKENPITVIKHGEDIYNRWLVEVLSQKRNVNLQMVELGAVMLYPYSRFESLDQQSDYIHSLMNSYRNRRGIFQCPYFQTPMSYRKKRLYEKYHGTEI